MDRLPEDWLFATLQDIKDAQQAIAAESRKGFQDIRAAMAAHELEDARTRSDVRVLTVRGEQQSDMKRHVQTLLISTGLVALWEAAKHAMSWK